MLLDQLQAPVVLAPLAGGPGTPELAAAVTEAGGLGFLPAGYVSAESLREQVARTRGLTSGRFGVNVFAAVPGPADPGDYREYSERVRAWAGDRGWPVGEPRYSDDELDGKIDALVADPVAVVSFTFGCPTAELVDRLHAVGSEVWVTVTTPDEAAYAVAAGSDALVVQGSEAGGHRASFVDGPDAAAYALLPLLQMVGTSGSVPLVAAGGIATGAALAAVLCAGARAAQIGTAFLLCPEAATARAHRDAVAARDTTALTRAYTGRLARGVRNAFMEAHDAAAPSAYPELHYLTAPMRRAARDRGDGSVINLWAGEAHSLARDVPAGDLVAELVQEARAAVVRLADTRLR